LLATPQQIWRHDPPALIEVDADPTAAEALNP
jgi:hypothetical protein